VKVAAVVEELTPAWLSEALGREVTAVEAERVGTGQIGASYRLHLAWDGPATLVAKLAAGDDEARARVSDGYKAEVRFYTELVSTVRVRTPHCWYGAVTDDGSNFTLLLDDLAPAVPGVQADGCTVAQATAAVENLAGLHAPRWCDPTLTTLGTMSFDASAAEFVGEVMRQGVAQFVERYAEQLEAEDVATLHESAEAMSAFLLARPERFALLHGDYRLDNLMFGEQVHVVDWQTLTVGLPGRDLGYFLGTSLKTTDRRSAEQGVVAAYHRALDIDGYDLATCWDDYRAGMFQGPMITVLGAIFATAERTDRADGMFLAMARRSCAAIRDLDAYSAL
jgi:fructosamine-3-kinase